MSKKRSIVNVVVSLSTQLIIIALGVILPKLVLTSYGSDINGFTSTIAQIFTWIALLEAGIGQSTLNSLYSPVANGNRAEISAKLCASRLYYRRITKIYGLLVVCVSLVAPFVIKTEINKITVCGYILLTGLPSVIGFYYLEAWKQLLSADGKYYVSQLVGMLTIVLTYVVKIVLVPLAVNIVWLQFAHFIITLIQLVVYKVYFAKHYSWVDFSVKPDFSALENRSAFMINHIAVTIFTSTDAIVLSTVCSTLITSVYSVYGLVFHNLVKVTDAIYFGTVYLLGQIWTTNRDKYPTVHDTFDMLTQWMITSTMSVAYLLTLPFVEMYTAGVEDVNYYYRWLPLLFCLIQMLSYNRYVNGNLMALSGNVKVISKVSILEAAINIVASIGLGVRYGIYGVLLATVIALPAKIVFCLVIANKTVMRRSVWHSLKILITNYALFLAVVVYSHFAPLIISDWIDFFKNGLIASIVIFPGFLAVNIVCSLNTYRRYIPVLKNIILKLVRR